MALRVWLPLNGNLNNLGLSPAVAEAVTTASFSEGKIGQCLSGGKIKIPANYVGDIFNNEHMSICFWYYTNTDATTGNHSICGFSGNGEGDSGAVRSWDFFAYSVPTTLHWSMGTIGGGSLANVLPNNQWTHIAVTFDGSKLLIYLNGILKYTGNGSSNFTFDKSYYISFGSALQKLNDFRIYDECLSPKQIKEISKGLVAHYKLDTPTNINNLVRNSTYNIYNNFGVTATLVKLNERYNNCDIYRLTMTPTESSLSSFQNTLHSHGIYGFSRTFTASTKYCFWILWRPVTHFDVVVGGTASNIGGWTEIASQEWGDGWNIVGQKRTGSVTENKSDSIFTSFKCPSAVVGTPISIDFCCPHLVEGYDYILDEFDYQGNNPNYVEDCSGYGYTATKNGTLTFNTDSPRYSGCNTFDANTSYLKPPAMTTAGFANSFTIIYWAKIIDMDGKMAWGFEDGNRLNIYPTGSVICCNTGDSANNPYQNNGTSIAYSQWNNGWHQFAMTADGASNKLYVDGELQGTAKTYKGMTGTQIYLSGWASGNNYRWTSGSLSDFRIYATVLSADDIKELYQTSAIIDDGNNMYAYEFVEE